MKRNFTDKFIRSLKPARAGKSYEHWDTAVPNFGIRVSDKGHKAFIVYTRWNSRSPARRTVGDASKLSLADARRIARGWLNQLEQGIDPHERQRIDAQDAARKRRATFASVAEDWFRDELKRQRNADEVERAIRREFVMPWGNRPMSEITTLEVRDIIKAKALGHIPAAQARKRGPAPEQARNLLQYVKSIFNYAVEQHAYGLERSPAETIKAARLIGNKTRRNRVLSDHELGEVWEAAEETAYPWGPMFCLLILTGQRRTEVAAARWREFDFERKLWTIPPERMKMRVANVVPLVDDMIALLDSLPRFQRGDYVFSTTFGAKPVSSFTKPKKDLDELSNVKNWVIHDLRRTMRTGLSALPIPDRVREMMIAHAPPGLHRVYDLYSYVEEKRQGFALWCARVRGILQPQTSNVVRLQR